MYLSRELTRLETDKITESDVIDALQRSGYLAILAQQDLGDEIETVKKDPVNWLKNHPYLENYSEIRAAREKAVIQREITCNKGRSHGVSSQLSSVNLSVKL